MPAIPQKGEALVIVLRVRPTVSELRKHASDNNSIHRKSGRTLALVLSKYCFMFMYWIDTSTTCPVSVAKFCSGSCGFSGILEVK